MRDAGKAIFYLSYPINSIGSAGRAHNAPPRPPSRVGRAPLSTPLSIGAFGPRFLEVAFGAYLIHLSGPPPF